MRNDCVKHKKELLGISYMSALATMVGDMHYKTLTEFLYELSEKIEADAGNDNSNGRVKLASALQYAGMSIFESALRMERVWKISEPFMNTEELNEK